MVFYPTKSDLRNYASGMASMDRASMRERAARRSIYGATFLSHSTKDEEFVVGAMRILENHGASIYIDKVDPKMPPHTNKETAAALKTRISQSKNFVLLATENSKDSNWVPWELGIADGVKGLSKIALFPAVDNLLDTSWTTWEYMGLYRRIVWGKLEGHQNPLWMVFDEDANSATALSDWLSR